MEKQYIGRFVLWWIFCFSAAGKIILAGEGKNYKVREEVKVQITICYVDVN